MMMFATLLALNSFVNPITVDSGGVLRWRASRQVPGFFGANYCLPSALDFRAAKRSGRDLKEVIRQDVSHFRRMGWNAVRLSFWGDWECSDSAGNLVVNEHLDLLDYLVAEGAKHGISFLLSPIVTYDARWPEMKEYPEASGFSRTFDRGRLGTDHQAWKAQANYLQQLLRHVNPYTKRSYAEEPNIPFIEMINEPWHHPNDLKGSVDYINRLVQAVRDSGSRALTFHNVSQDFAIEQAVAQSQVDGATYGWYPSGLIAGHQLHTNFLRAVDHYPAMKHSLMSNKPKLVYEFDMPDTISSCYYPAMTRAFREGGAQWATMFSYDMLSTASTNAGWTTHLLNLVTTPKKAVSAMIAADVMRRLPLGQTTGEYPANLRFGDFRVDPDRDLAEEVTVTDFLYSNNTSTRPSSITSLRRIAGVGSSPVVQYDGTGSYYLDQIDPSHWRLEVQPDSVQVDDPFNDPSASKIAFQIVHREWPMEVRLPGLGNSFQVTGINDGNATKLRATNGRFLVAPGVYLLGKTALQKLPTTVAGLPTREFVTLPPTHGTRIRAEVTPFHRLGKPLRVVATVARDNDSQPVELFYRDLRFKMNKVGAYQFQAQIPSEALLVGKATMTIHVGDIDSTLATTVAPAESPIVLVSPRNIGDGGVTRGVEGTWSKGDSVFPFGLKSDKWIPEDYTISTNIPRNVAETMGRTTNVILQARARTSKSRVRLTLVDVDGAAWSKVIDVPADGEVRIPLSEFRPSRWVMLPQGYPDGLSYWCSASVKNPVLSPERLERVQFSIRREDLTGLTWKDGGADILSVSAAEH